MNKFKEGDRVWIPRHEDGWNRDGTLVAARGTVSCDQDRDLVTIQLDDTVKWSDSNITQLLSEHVRPLDENHVWKVGDPFIIPYCTWMTPQFGEQFFQRTGVVREVRYGLISTALDSDTGYNNFPKFSRHASLIYTGPEVPTEQEQYKMNPLQEKTWNYLMEDGHTERKQALRELSQNGFFTAEGEEGTEVILAAFIDGWQNEGTFCEAGCDRAREALLPPPEPETTGEVDVWFELAIRVPADQAKGYRNTWDQSFDTAAFVEKVKSLVRDAGICGYGSIYYVEDSKYPDGSDIHSAEVTPKSHLEYVRPPRA